MHRAKVLLLTISTCATLAIATDLDSKVVNGSLAASGEFPFVVSLRRSSSGSHFCGGSLLDPLWVLTAAHCVHKQQSNGINIQYGSTELERNSTNTVNVSNIYVHEEYIGANNTFRNDIALLRLSQEVEIGKNVTVVKRPTRNIPVPNGTPSVLIGWGYNTTGGVVQQHLQKVDLQIFDWVRCSLRHGQLLHSTNICAGVPEGWQGQCSGDSGGPLLVNGTQVGIVSWSIKPCARPPYPGVYTRVSSYIDWINTTMSNNGEVERKDTN